MTFDQDVLLWCAAVPALIALAAALAAWACEARITNSRRGQTAAALIVSLGWCAAVLIGLAARREWAWLPEEFWHQAIWPVLAAAVVLGASTAADWAAHSWRWVAAGLLAITLGWLSLPSGEGWEDMLPLHRNWMAAIAASCLLNGWSIDRLSRHHGQRWSLWIVLAGLAGPFALAAATYGALAEWGLAAIGATLACALIAIFPSAKSLWSVAFPAFFFQASLTAASRFYSYEDHPWWLYGVALFSPSLVALVDLPFRNRATWLRVIIAAVVAALLVGLCVWKGLIAGQEPSWQ